MLERGVKIPDVQIPTERLDGDQLFAWASVVTRERLLQQEKQTLAQEILNSRGKIPGEHLLSDDGYIITPEDLKRLRNQAVQPPPAGPLRSPGNGSAALDHHTSDPVSP